MLLYEGILAKIDTATRVHKEKILDLLQEREDLYLKVSNTITKNKENWTSDYQERYREEHYHKKDQYFRIEIAKRQKMTQAEIRPLMIRLEKNLKEYFMRKPRADFSAEITALAALGMKLSDTEIELLRETADCYLERRMISQLLENRAADNNAKGELDLGAAYAPLEVPEPGETLKQFAAFRNETDFFVSEYCGEAAELCELLPNDKEHYPEMSIGAFGYTANHKVDEIRGLFDRLAKYERRELSREQKAENQEAVGNYQQEESVRIKSKDPEWAERFRYDDRYCHLVPEEKETA